jgi:hypothetical protein
MVEPITRLWTSRMGYPFQRSLRLSVSWEFTVQSSPREARQYQLRRSSSSSPAAKAGRKTQEQRSQPMPEANLLEPGGQGGEVKEPETALSRTSLLIERVSWKPNFSACRPRTR